MGGEEGLGRGAEGTVGLGENYDVGGVDRGADVLTRGDAAVGGEGQHRTSRS